MPDITRFPDLEAGSCDFSKPRKARDQWDKLLRDMPELKPVPSTTAPARRDYDSGTEWRWDYRDHQDIVAAWREKHGEEIWLAYINSRREALCEYHREHEETFGRYRSVITTLGTLFLGGAPVIGPLIGGAQTIAEIADDNAVNVANDFISVAEIETENIEDWIQALLTVFIDDTQRSIGDSAADVIGQIGQQTTSAIGTIESVTSSLVSSIEFDLSDAIAEIVNLFGITNDTLDDLLRGNATLVEALTERAISAVSESIGISAGIISTSFADIGEAIVPLLTDAAREQAETSDLIQTALETQIDQSERNARVAETSLRDAIDEVVTASDSALAVTREALEGTGAEQVLATREAGAEVASATSEGFTGLTQTIGDFVSATAAGTDAETLQAVRDNLSKIAQQTGCPEDFNNVIQAFMAEIFGVFSVMGGITQAQLLLAIGTSLMTPVLDVLSNCIAQAAARQVPTSLPDFPQIRDQRNRRIIDDNEAINNLLSQGFSIERATDLLDQRRALPDIGIVQAWWLRGFIDTERATQMLLDLGFDAEGIENILRMAFFVPPTGDLITMAVREVFSPEIAARFGQFEDFPQDFADFARLQGVSEEWARNYWAAHWALPSAQQGFEMFQRKVISEEDLQSLLRALDVMPFWRDKLTKIAYRPIPRVDVRRLNALGLISDADLPARYESFGFAPPDAQLMAEFTLAYNARTGGEDTSELSGVTRSMAINFFKRGTLTRAQTVEVLQDQGLSEQAINILITDAEMQREMEERDQQTKLIIEQAKAGAITFENAQDQLGQLGLEPTELASALTTLEREKASRTKLPTRADGDRFLKAGIITESQYIDLLERLGYSSVWAQRYLQAGAA